jgi:hypothetical protein
LKTDFEIKNRGQNCKIGPVKECVLPERWRVNVGNKRWVNVVHVLYTHIKKRTMKPFATVLSGGDGMRERYGWGEPNQYIIFRNVRMDPLIQPVQANKNALGKKKILQHNQVVFYRNARRFNIYKSINIQHIIKIEDKYMIVKYMYKKPLTNVNIPS